MWLVDVDRLPDLGRWRAVLGAVRPADHLDGGDLRAGLGRVLAERGISLGECDRILMLANPRTLGSVFDPLTVYWVRPVDDATPPVVVLEVHNTYGGRHAYVLIPGPAGRCSVDKQFYVSPFHDVSGRYDVVARARRSRVLVSVALDQPGAGRFTSSVSGSVHPLTRTSAARSALTRPVPGWRVPVLIRLHGIRLWLGRLPVRPRPEHHVRSDLTPMFEGM